MAIQPVYISEEKRSELLSLCMARDSWTHALHALEQMIALGSHPDHEVNGLGIRERYAPLRFQAVEVGGKVTFAKFAGAADLKRRGQFFAGDEPVKATERDVQTLRCERDRDELVRR